MGIWLETGPQVCQKCPEIARCCPEISPKPRSGDVSRRREDPAQTMQSIRPKRPRTPRTSAPHHASPRRSGWVEHPHPALGQPLRLHASRGGQWMLISLSSPVGISVRRRSRRIKQPQDACRHEPQGRRAGAQEDRSSDRRRRLPPSPEHRLRHLEYEVARLPRAEGDDRRCLESVLGCASRPLLKARFT